MSAPAASVLAGERQGPPCSPEELAPETGLLETAPGTGGDLTMVLMRMSEAEEALKLWWMTLCGALSWM
eukprot:5477087-Prorocentrum_lima.AAC.1